MTFTVFSYSDYKACLRQCLARPDAINMAELARRTKYQRSFFSRVINGELHLTTEGVFKVANALGFAETEREYFHWLVEIERAADPAYRAHAKAQASRLRRDHEVKLKAAQTPLKSDEGYFSQYLSSWLWVAVHLATAVPDLQTPERIAARFGVPLEQIQRVLDGLEAMGLVMKKSGGYRFQTGSVHIAENSPWVLLHHNNWRQKAILDAQARTKESIHFTNILTVTAKDRDLIRAKLLETIESVMRIAKPSDPKEIVCLNLDYFRA